MSASASDSTALLLDRLTRLPDLTAMARDPGAKDAYVELERLKREHDAAGAPYRFSMPYRHPPRPCSSGAHNVPSVKHMLVNPAQKEAVGLWEAERHEADAHGAALPEAVAAFLRNLGDSGAVAPSMPQSLEFAFGAVRLVKHGSDITLTVKPVWSDAQTGPPPGFEDNVRVRRLSSDEFAALWRELGAIDFARYARVIDADFETTPPDLRHFEHLSYAVNGEEVVSWGRSYEWLRAELRQPLSTLERKLEQTVTSEKGGHGQGQAK